MVQEHRGEYPSLWATIESIAPKIGCAPPTLHEWVKKHEIDSGQRDGITSEEREHIKSLERENKELRRPSVGSRGDSYDNAWAETINGLYKTELIYKRDPWKNRESVEMATLEWVHGFNHHRLLEPIGYIPPAEAEAQYYRQLTISDSAIVT